MKDLDTLGVLGTQKTVFFQEPPIEYVQKIHILEKKLAIATKALEKFKEKERNYLDYGIDNDGNENALHPNRVATKALKEMEGVK